MKNAIKPIEVNIDTKNFDVQFVRDKKKKKNLHRNRYRFC